VTPAGRGGATAISPVHGTVVAVLASPGDVVAAGAVVALVESMKLHHEVVADGPGRVLAVSAVGDLVAAGAAVAELGTVVDGAPDRAPDPGDDRPAATTGERADLAEVVERHRLTTDAARPDAVERRRRLGRRTARENLAQLFDDGSFVEYGPLVVAAQRRRRTVEDLRANTPADGLVGGIGTINRAVFGDAASRAVAVSYDYTVLAGTQGTLNHRKKDRLFALAAEQRVPVVLFAEGGGGRPGDTEVPGPTGLDSLAFGLFAELSALVPLVGIAAGYCFAGNAALLGCCDVVIATEDSNIGMGGPAMIEGGGLGVWAPTDIGPIGVQRANGVVDVVVADEAAAVAAATRYLSYFQGPWPTWEAADQALLRDVVPADRLRVYDMRRVLDLLFDRGSVFELRRDFAAGMITALARIEGRTIGVLANDPAHLGGAIDSAAADKAARFLQLCDAFALPIVTLCDTPGFMVGPDAEAGALVRHCSRLFVIGANLTVPRVAVVTRKAYGLGAMAMMGGSTKAPLGCFGWPASEFGGMGLEGAVRLGYRRELDAEPDEGSRQALFDRLVARHYEQGKGVSVAEYFEIDDVIDPAATRRVIGALLGAWTPPARTGRTRPNVDTW